MGYLKEKHGMTLLGNIPKDTCLYFATLHPADQPHNRDSLTYQYKFYDLNGHFPTWADAMSHCTPEVKERWIAALKERGVKV